MGEDGGRSGRSPSLSRRDFIRYSLITSALPAAAVVTEVTFGLGPEGGSSDDEDPEFLIKREADELLLKVKAVGFRARPGARRLTPSRSANNHLLVFTLPPQHFAEATLSPQNIPETLTEAQLATIDLLPSAPTTIVFRVPRARLELSVEALLDWSRFELLLPDTAASEADYDLEVVRDLRQAISRIELPWGVELAPVPGGPKLVFTGAPSPRTVGSWTELWSAALQPEPGTPGAGRLRMEVFSVRGFRRLGESGSIEQGTYVVTYGTDPSSAALPRSPPMENRQRAELAASLCRRFPYTGRVNPLRYSAKIHLRDEARTVIAAYAPGRAVEVDQFRVTSRGGYLALRAKWIPYPGADLTGWMHDASLGRDHKVEIVKRGYLFPFGTPCELVQLSERVFSKDTAGHFTAPLIKQMFLRIPQPNQVEVGHGESPFRTLSVTTAQSPPLDLPPSGNPAEYDSYEFFLPMVNGAPFRFQHLGIDWAGDAHRSDMPMLFVANGTLAPNGLIWEPGYAWPPDTTNPGSGPLQHRIPRGGDGLRVVDKFWAAQPGRFARYGRAIISLASAVVHGTTAQKVEWIEWVRGNIPNLAPVAVAPTPFRPRARTMRIQNQATEHLSGEPTAMLATYRDVRFTYQPFLDPEPTMPPDDYFANMTSGSQDPERPYLYFLESRALIGESGPPAARPPGEVAADIRDLYYRVSSATDAAPTELFDGISNEIQFGRRNSAEGVGGLTVPDTHAGLANRRFGVVGDATFNERRWPGMAAAKPKLENAQRLDFAAYARARGAPFDQNPFDATRTEADRNQAIASARSLMGFAALLAAAERRADPGPFAPGLKLGDLFGIDAELIPGLRFADIFEDILLAGSENDGAAALARDGATEVAAEPLSWNVKLTGIEWLARLQRSGDLAPSLPALLRSLLAQARTVNTGRALSLGVEATLSWSNSVFKRVEIGPVAFIPTPETQITIEAAARVDMGVPRIESNPPRLAFSPGSPKLNAATQVNAFAVEIFSAIRVHFESVSFTIAPDGSKSFSTRISTVELLPPLDFINQLQSMLGGLGGDNGIKIEISPQQARIYQVLNFPVSGGILFIGPAQVTNLSFSWSVTIPLMGRDVMCVAFGISSREKPLTIFVPPWYGGKAYALLEATTRGCRLVEISMEYGALVPINWSIARGQASLTAGIFFQLRQIGTSTRVELQGFVKAASDLSVAGIIKFNGLIFITLSYIIEAGQKIVMGTAGIRVSIKIGFVRYSYSFTAKHEQRQAARRSDAGAPGIAASAGLNMLPLSAGPGREDEQSDSAALPFGNGFSADARSAYERLLAGYRSEGRGK